MFSSLRLCRRYLTNIIAGITLIGLGYAGLFPGITAIAGYIIGGVALVTGMTGICPAYALFGMNTCPIKQRKLS